MKMVSTGCLRWKRTGILKTLLLLPAVILFAGNRAEAQQVLDHKITLSLKSLPLRDALDSIGLAAGVKFAYSENVNNLSKQVSYRFSGETLEQVLKQVLTANHLSYKLVNRMIVVKNAAVAPVSRPAPVRDTVSSSHGIKGRVLNEKGLPVENASVVIKGSATGTTTNSDGEFVFLHVYDTSVLSIGFAGYITRELRVDGQQQVAVSLTPESKELNEIVVVGYATQRKINLTGAVSVIKSEDLNVKTGGQTSALLQGLAPGLTVTQGNGQPGRDGGTVRIRGIGTLNSGNDPLVLVDGVQADLNNVDPSEIASISVLKDAASAAIYGSRAANGVILVTTRRANGKGTSLSYNTYMGWQRPTNLPKIVNAIDHMTMLNEAYTNVGSSPLYTQDYIDNYAKQMQTDPDGYPNTNWQKLLLTGDGFMQHHALTITSGTDKVKVLGNFSYLNQDAIIPNSNFKRYNLRLNTDIQASEKFSTSIDLFVRRTDLTEPSVSSPGTAYVFQYMNSIPANQSARYSNGNWGEGWNGENPLARVLAGGLATTSDVSAILNLGVKYKPTKWLTAEAYYSPKYDEPHYRSFLNIIQTYKTDMVTPSFRSPTNNSLTDKFTRDWYNNVRALLTYNQSFGKHQLTVLGGYQQEDDDNSYVSAYRDSFPFPQYQQINAGGVNKDQSNGGTETQWALRSYFGRINYNYKMRYLLEVNGRYDGSSRFAPGNRYAFFPSVSGGWRISEEPFMQNFQDVLNNLKIRASWGKLGNQNISALYSYLSSVSQGLNNSYVFGGQYANGAGLTALANSNIKWETTTQTDVGLDATLWRKLNITADYYYRKTYDILLALPIPSIIGLGAPFQNAGVVQNKGWEFSASYSDRIGELNYTVTANLSDVQNKILDLKGVKITGLTSTIAGYPINALYGYVAQGYFQSQDEIAKHAKQTGKIAPGDIKYQDLNGDGVIDSKDQRVIGSNIPRYTYNLNLGLNWKGFDLTVFAQGVGKVDGYIDKQGIMPFYQNGTVQEQHKNHWTPANPNAAFPRLTFGETNNFLPSTFWVKNAAYLRIKNLQLGYTLPNAVLQRIRIKKIRVYASGQNLFTIDHFWNGYDVEAPVGIGNYYPQVKTYTFGLDVNF